MAPVVVGSKQEVSGVVGWLVVGVPVLDGDDVGWTRKKIIITRDT